MSVAEDEQGTSPEELAEQLADLAGEHDVTVATAESLTGGQVAARLSAAPSSSTWFRGSVVAYSSEVKFSLLGVPEGPVVTEECARTMADSAARLLSADVAVAVTGVGGPDDEEGKPAGTVWLAVHVDGTTTAELRHFDGDPPEVVEATTTSALQLLLDGVRATRP